MPRRPSVSFVRKYKALSLTATVAMILHWGSTEAERVHFVLVKSWRPFLLSDYARALCFINCAEYSADFKSAQNSVTVTYIVFHTVAPEIANTVTLPGTSGQFQLETHKGRL